MNRGISTSQPAVIEPKQLQERPGLWRAVLIAMDFAFQACSQKLSKHLFSDMSAYAADPGS